MNKKSQLILVSLLIVIPALIILFAVLISSDDPVQPTLLSRTATTETSCDETGKCTTTIYSTLKYMFNGTDYIEINSTMIPYNVDGYDYKTNKAPYTLYIKKNSDWGDGVKYCVNESGKEYCLTYQAQDMSFRDIYGSQDYITSINNVVGSIVDGRRIIFNDTFPNTTLEYITNNAMIKEKYILKNKTRNPASYLTNATLDFGGYIKYPNLEIYVNNTKKTGNFVTSSRVEFRINNTNITIFYLPEPYAIDSNHSRINLQYEVKTGNPMWFYVRTPWSWLNNTLRVYPITIDPTIQLNTANDTADVSVDDRETGDRNSRLQMKWDISSIPASVPINDAELCLYMIDNLGTDNDANISRFRNQIWVEADAPLNPTFINETTDKTWSSIIAATWSCINVSLQVQESYNEGEKNLSLKLEDPDYMLTIGEARDNNLLYFGTLNVGAFITFEDRENYGTTGNTPYLNVTYTAGGGDTTAPLISIVYPTNTTYNVNVSNLNYTVDDETAESSCWYSRDIGATNSTAVTAGINFTNVVSVFGNNTYTLYCNDTTNNINTTSVTFTANTISGCQKITLPGNYTMIGNIINSATTACINITTENVTLDGQNYLIDGNDAADYGIWIERNPAINTNITITNCALNDWDTEAIHITGAHGNNLSNVNVTSSPNYGIYSRNSNNSIFENVKILNSLASGIYLSYSYYNNLTGINTTDSSLYGIYISTSSYNLIKNFFSLRGTGGIYLESSNYNNIINLITTQGSKYGIYLDSANSNNITNLTSIQDKSGIYLESFTSQNNLIINSTIERSTNTGIYLSFSHYNNIYNNLFNNSNNFQIIGTMGNNWNTTTVTGTNIVGGPKIAGNFWATPTGTGFSQTPSLCQDIDGDGICNNNYTLWKTNIDYSPLSDITAADTAPPKVYFTSYPVGKINGEQIYFSGYLEDETIGKNLTFIVYNGTTSTAVLAVNTTSSLRIYLSNYFNSSPYTTGENLTFKFLAYDLAGNSNQTNITLVVDHKAPIISPNPLLNPWITPIRTYYRTNDVITLRINVTDGSGAGMNYVQINPKNINGTDQYINMTLESGNKGSGNYSTFNFTMTVNNETDLNKPIYFYLVDLATPVPNTLNYTMTYNLDNAIPTYSSLGSSTPITNNTAGLFYVTAFDNYDLGSYIFAQNSTGTWVNNSPVSISGISYTVTTTFTPTIVGNFSYYFIINDTAGNQNTTILGDTEVIEPSNLIVYLHYPSNNVSLPISTIQLNWSYEMGVAINCSLYIDGTFNQTSSTYPSNYTIYNFTVGFSDGSYYWYVNCIQNETWGVFNSEIWEFKVDTIQPAITIVHPTNSSYNVNVSNLNYTYSDPNPGSCWYSKDRGANNITSVLPGVNFSNVPSIEGSNNYTLYCNDTSNNLNSTWLYFWKDTIVPFITIVSPLNITYVTSTITFNVTLNEEGTWCGYSLDNTANVTMTRKNTTYFNYTKTGLSDAQHNITFICNDTSNNFNFTSIRYFMVDTTLPNILILAPANNTYFSLYEINITLNVSVNYSDITGYWWSYNEGKNNYSFTPNTTMSWDQPGRTTYVYNITVWVNDTANNVAYNISKITVYTAIPGDVLPPGGGGGTVVTSNITNITEIEIKKEEKDLFDIITNELKDIFFWVGSIISPSSPYKIGIPIFVFMIFATVIFYINYREKHKLKKEKPVNVTINYPSRKKKQWRT